MRDDKPYALGGFGTGSPDGVFTIVESVYMPFRRKGIIARSAIFIGIALALTVGSVPAFSKEDEGESRDALVQIARLAKELAIKHVSGRAEPELETPDMLPGLCEQIKANANTRSDESGA